MADASPPQAPAPAASARGEAGLFCMHAGGSRWAFDAAQVAEVVRLGLLTRLPAAPPFLHGVFVHRGEVLAVLDLGLLVGGRAAPLGPDTRAAVVRAGPWTVALVGEGVEGLSVPGEAGLSAPPAHAGAAAPFVAAVGADARGPLAVLDLVRLVESARARSLPA